MDLVIRKTADTPLYLQIYEQIVTQITNQKLPAHFCLPSIRFVAKELKISVISVKNAYDVLENAGYIYTIAGKGCFVAEQINKKEKSDELITQKAAEIIEFCQIYNIDPRDIFDKINEIKG